MTEITLLEYAALAIWGRFVLLLSYLYLQIQNTL